MKKIITSALVLALTIGAAQAQQTEGKQKDGQRKEHKGRKDHKGHGFDQLNLTSDQQARLKTIREDFKKQSQELRKQDQITVAEMKTRREALHSNFRTQMESVLTADQKSQLAKMKTERTASFKDGQGRKGDVSKRAKVDGSREGRKGREGFRQGKDDLAKELNLTKEQQDKMASARASLKTQIETVKNDSKLSDEQKKERIRELSKSQKEQMKSILTKEQMEKMESLRKERSARHTR
jgi:Spy/CpxP family protein refolding chaperone